MNKDGNLKLKRISKTAVGLACVALALVFTYLTVFSLRYTYIFDPKAYSSEHMLRIADAILPNLLLCLLFLAALRFFSGLEKKLSLRLVTALTLAVPFAAGIVWVYSARVYPRADQAYLFKTAAQLIAGDVNSIVEKGSYIQRLPYQIGQLLYFEGVERLAGTERYRAFQLINVASLALTYGALLSILWQALHNRRAQLAACGLLLLFAPGVLYCTFVYGNLPGLALALWGVERCVSWVRHRGAGRVCAAIALLSIACVVKTNYLITALAVAITTLLYALHECKWKIAVVALCLFMIPLGVGRLPTTLLEARTGAAFRSGTPQTAWLAMGMQEGSRAAGWYNQYPWDVIAQNDFDASKTEARIQSDIQARLAIFEQNPAYWASFYHSKLTTQWAETTFESLWVNRVGKFDATRPAWVEPLLTSEVLTSAMDGYANALYLAFAVGLAALALGMFRRNGLAFPDTYGLTALMAAVFGGLLYHLLFEAKSQYLLPYLLMMIPIASVGLALPARNVTVWMRSLFNRRKSMV